MLGPDIRHALNRWRRQPLFAAAIAALLSMGLGINIAVFALVDAALIRPLPFEDAEDLVHFWQVSSSDGALTNFSHPTFVDIDERSRTMQDVAAYHSPSMTLTRGERARSVEAVRVSSNFFALLGVEPALGRSFRADEDGPDGERVVLLSDAFWRAELGADRDVLGRTLVLDGSAHTVIGVLPRSFVFPRERRAEIWRPLVPNEREATAGAYRWMHIIGRLRSGLELAEAQREMDELAAAFARESPGANANRGLELIPMRDQVVGDTRPALFAVLGGVALLLLITCTNLAHLTLARVLARRGELEVRKALGATRGQLVLHVMTEFTLLFLVGGVTGALTASWLIESVLRLVPDEAMLQSPFLSDPSVSGRVLVYALGLSLGLGALFGLVPALRVSNSRARESANGSRVVAARAGMRVIVASQVSITVMLLATTVLFVRSSLALLRVDPGFDADNLMTLRISLPAASYAEGSRIAGFNRELVQRVQSLPGVLGAAAVDRIPLSGNLSTAAVGVPNLEDEADRRAANVHLVTPEYFDVMRMRLLRGRLLAATDDEHAPAVVVVNELLAAELFPAQEPVGRDLEVGVGSDAQAFEVVGVVADVKVHTIEAPAAPAMYISAAQLPSRSTGLVVRTRRDPSTLVPDVRAELSAIDRTLDIYEVSSMRDLINQSPDVIKRTIPALLLSAFAVFAATLVGIGIFAVVGRDVAGRTREIGIRRAVGAPASSIVREIVSSTLVAVSCGVLVGSALAVVGARLLRSLLFGVGPADPAALLATSALTMLVAALACVGPVKRALGIYPTEALRSE